MRKILKTGLLISSMAFFAIQANASFEVYDDSNMKITTVKKVNKVNIPFNGFYAGGELDAMSLIHDDTKNIYKISAPTTSWYNQEYRSGAFGYGGGIFGGYGKTFNRFYTGIELSAHYVPYDCLDHEYSVNGVTKWKPVELKSKYYYGAVLREGYLFSPTVLVYGLLGINADKFEAKTEYDAYPSTDQNFSKAFDKTEIGYTPGLGVEFAVSSHLALRVQGAYVWYPEFDESFDQGIYSHKMTVQPSGSVFSLGATYYFNNVFNKKANTFNSVNNLFMGPYLGAGLNVMHGIHKDTDTDTVTSQTPNIVYTHEFRGGVTGVGETLTGGYGFFPIPTMNRFYLGADAFAQYVPTDRINRDLTDQAGSNENSVETSYFFGADIKAGYLVTSRFLFYGLLGPKVGRFRLIESMNQPPSQIGRSATILYKWGIMPGIGSELALTQHVSMVTQYTETFYSKNTWHFSNVSSREHDLDFQPSIAMFTLGVNYHF